MPRARSKAARVREYIIAGLLALLIVWLLVLIVGIFRKEEIARRTAHETSAQLAILREREASLTESMAELKTPRGHEATLRETYGVARPGEEVIIVVPPKEATTTLPVPWWKKAVDWVTFKRN